MKKTLPYILIAVALLVGAGIFVNATKSEDDFLNISFKNNSSKSEEEATEPGKPKFQNLGPAPELTGLSTWLNSDPLTSESLKGKVVLVDFWTYSCINCIRTLPYVTEWYDKYKDDGLVILGIHTPEFAFERVTSNVESAIKRYKINYPVAQDNNYKTWSAFDNRFWPAHYLIDKEGDIVYTHFGEGKYAETELAIRTLLGLEGEFEQPEQAVVNQAQTSEIYLGTARLEKSYGGPERPSSNEQVYTFPKKLLNNKFALEGKWKFSAESVTLTKDFGRLRLDFNAANAFMVAEANKPTTVKVYIDGKLDKGVVVDQSDLYTLFESEIGSQHVIELEIPNGELQIFTFTFG